MHLSSSSLIFCLILILVLPAGSSTADEESQQAAKQESSQQAGSTDAAEAENEASDDADSRPEATESEQKESENEELNATVETDSESTAEDTKEKKKKSKQQKKEPRKTHEVEQGPFKVTIDLEGTFVARQMSEVVLRPDVWSDFKIEEIVEHGSEVHEGEVLIKFDGRKLNEAIASLELDLHLSDLAIRKAEQELPRLEKTLQLNLADAERTLDQAQEDYDRFKELEQSFYEKMVEYSVKNKEYDLSYVKEELDQLEKMYEADDLTEETEEIILQRHRNQLDLAEFSLEDAKFFRESVLNVTLPRMENRLQNVVEAAKLNLARAKMSESLDLNRSRYELEKLKQSRLKSQERHSRLLTDRALLEIKSPVAGVVYYGSCRRGRWSDMASMISKLRPFAKVPTSSVLMTIVEPRPLYVLATVPETDRPNVQSGQKAKVSLPPKDSEKLSAKVSEVSHVPVSTGKFSMELDLDEQDLPDWLVAGMSCDFQVTSYDAADAVTVPAKAVHTEKENETEHYVWLLVKENEKQKVEKQPVEIGQRDKEQVEILKGLKAGDEISLEDEDQNKE